MIYLPFEHFVYPFSRDFPFECLKLMMTCKYFYSYKERTKVNFFLKLKIIFDEKSKNIHSYEWLKIFPYKGIKNFQYPLLSNDNNYLFNVLRNDKLFMLTTGQYSKKIKNMELDRVCEFWHSITTDENVCATLKNQNETKKIKFEKGKEIMLNLPAFILFSQLTFEKPVDIFYKVIFLREMEKHFVVEMMNKFRKLQ